MKRNVALGLALTLSILLVTCDGSDPKGASISETPVSVSATEPPTAGSFSFSASECTYDGPETMAAGQVTFALVSTDGEADFDLWKLDEGHTYEELAAHVAKEVKLAGQGRPPLGYPTFAELIVEATTDPDGGGTLTASVEAGEYGMACIRFGDDGAFVTAGPFEVI
jgi:hypothetical protein